MAREASIARRGFGRIERRESGRYRAAYTGPDGRLYRAPTTFDAKDDAVAWLSARRAEIQMEVWAPDAAARGASRRTVPTMKAYGDQWLEGRKTRDGSLDRHHAQRAHGSVARQLHEDAFEQRGHHQLLQPRDQRHDQLRLVSQATNRDGLLMSTPRHIPAALPRAHQSLRPTAALRALVGVAAALVVLLAAGCTSDGGAFESIRASNDNADRVRSYGSWNELVGLARQGKPATDPMYAAIVGDVARVERGRSFTWDVGPEGEEERIELEFGSKDAMVSTYHVTVDVSSVIGSAGNDIQAGSAVLVGVAIDADVSLGEVESDFAGLKNGVFFLQRSPVFDYEDGLYAIVEDGALMALPEDGGELTFPLLEKRDSVQPPPGLEVADLVR